MICTFCGKDANCGGLKDNKLACEFCLDVFYEIKKKLSSTDVLYIEKNKLKKVNWVNINR